MSDIPILVTIVRRRARMPDNKPIPAKQLSDLIGKLRQPESYSLVPILLGGKTTSKTLSAKAAAVRFLALGAKA